MKLHEFIAEQREKLTAFEEFWRVGMVATPSDFPNEMGEGDWDEQLAIFQTPRS
jgi:hypothetical protein